MTTSKGWIGVDLDGTLAHYDGWKGVAHIGEPVELMAESVRSWIRQGKDVRIFTARVSGDDANQALFYISEWCLKHLGQKLPVTCRKDFAMEVLYDDRCRQVLTNEGIVVLGG